MKHGLNIRQEGALDLVSLGALVHDWIPGYPFRKANIAISTSAAANLTSQPISPIASGCKPPLPAHGRLPIGDLIAERVRAMGVKPIYKLFNHNGVNGPNMATVYSDRGQGLARPSFFTIVATKPGAQNREISIGRNFCRRRALVS